MPAAPTVWKRKGGIQPIRKVNIMTKIRRAFTRPLISHKIRTFASLNEASRYTGRLLEGNPRARFNIQQTAADTWTVCRIVSGGLAA